MTYTSLDAADVPAAAARLRTEQGARLVLVFAEDRLGAENAFHVYYVFERPGDPDYLILRASLAEGQTSFPSLAAELPAVNWQEREIQDCSDWKPPDTPIPAAWRCTTTGRTYTRCGRTSRSTRSCPPFEGEQHEYRPTLGEGVFQIPVGPVHAGIIEPGHFNFAVAGEPILYLQLRMFYTHKGTEKLFEHLPVHRAVFLAESISGDSAFSHGTAFCQAIERAAEIEVPLRARFMRTVLLELERVYNHIADIGAIATDVGFVVANAHAGQAAGDCGRPERRTDGKPAPARHGFDRRGAKGLGPRADCCAPRHGGGHRAGIPGSGRADQVLRFHARPFGATRASCIRTRPRPWGSWAWAAAPPESTWMCGAIIRTPLTTASRSGCRCIRRETSCTGCRFASTR